MRPFFFAGDGMEDKKRDHAVWRNPLKLLVGDPGFEPGTSTV